MGLDVLHALNPVKAIDIFLMPQKLFRKVTYVTIIWMQLRSTTSGSQSGDMVMTKIGHPWSGGPHVACLLQ